MKTPNPKNPPKNLKTPTYMIKVGVVIFGIFSERIFIVNNLAD